MKNIYIATDHAGYELKEILKKHLNDNNYNVIDLGPSNNNSVSYVSYGKKLAREVVADKKSFGIIICGTGIGISISANKVKGARAALCYNEEYAKLSRQHNDANILSLGARFTASYHAKNIVDVFLNTKFESGRHKSRVEEIDNDSK